MSNGYSKEKADELIKEHEQKAKEYEEEARLRQGVSNPGGAGKAETDEYRRQAGEERQKAENLKELKKHHGDS